MLDRFSRKGLPKELLKQLAKVNTKEQTKKQTMMLDIIKELYEGKASKNEILVGFYKKYNMILKRTEVTSLVVKSIRQEYLEPIKKSSGNYRLTDLDDSSDIGEVDLTK